MSSSRFADHRIGHRIHGGQIELGNDLLRRTLWYPERIPDRHVKSRQAGFIDRGNVRCRAEACLCRDRIGSDLAGFHVRQSADCLVKQQVDLPADQILLRQVGAAIGHELEARARLLLEEHAADMRHAARATSSC